jgi:hypothetical protein
MHLPELRAPVVPHADSDNGRLDDVALRRAERAILESVPAPIDPAEEARLLAADPDLEGRLAKLVCWGYCTAEQPCAGCLQRRRYLALRLHRERYGPAPHPADAYYADVEDRELLSLPDNESSFQGVYSWDRRS